MKMKQLFASGAISVFSLMLAMHLHAQNQPASQDTRPGAAQSPQGQRPQPQPQPSGQQSQTPGQQSQPREGADASSGTKLKDQGKASMLIGMDVKNQQGETLGEVSEIAIDLASGRLAYVVIDVTDYLDSGDGEKLVAVPPQALTLSQDNLVLNADKQRMQRAPSFKESELPNADSPSWGAAYWGAGGRSSAAGQQQQTLSGRVVEIDADNKTVTVEGSNGRQVFAIDPSATVELSDTPDGKLSDLESGDQVIVIFSPQPDGSVIAYTIRERKSE